MTGAELTGKSYVNFLKKRIGGSISQNMISLMWSFYGTNSSFGFFSTFLNQFQKKPSKNLGIITVFEKPYCQKEEPIIFLDIRNQNLTKGSLDSLLKKLDFSSGKKDLRKKGKF